MITVYGAQASGSVAVEAALTLLGIPYALVEAATWVEEAARERVAPVNPMRQVPALVLEDGTIMTESAAILLWLADRHPDSGLAPLPTRISRASAQRSSRLEHRSGKGLQRMPLPNSGWSAARPSALD